MYRTRSVDRAASSTHHDVHHLHCTASRASRPHIEDAPVSPQTSGVIRPTIYLGGESQPSHPFSSSAPDPQLQSGPKRALFNWVPLNKSFTPPASPGRTPIRGKENRPSLRDSGEADPDNTLTPGRFRQPLGQNDAQLLTEPIDFSPVRRQHDFLEELRQSLERTEDTLRKCRTPQRTIQFDETPQYRTRTCSDASEQVSELESQSATEFKSIETQCQIDPDLGPKELKNVEDGSTSINLMENTLEWEKYDSLVMSKRVEEENDRSHSELLLRREDTIVSTSSKQTKFFGDSPERQVKSPFREILERHKFEPTPPQPLESIQIDQNNLKFNNKSATPQKFSDVYRTIHRNNEEWSRPLSHPQHPDPIDDHWPTVSNAVSAIPSTTNLHFRQHWHTKMPQRHQQRLDPDLKREHIRQLRQIYKCRLMARGEDAKQARIDGRLREYARIEADRDALVDECRDKVEQFKSDAKHGRITESDLLRRIATADRDLQDWDRRFEQLLDEGRRRNQILAQLHANSQPPRNTKEAATSPVGSSRLEPNEPDQVHPPIRIRLRGGKSEKPPADSHRSTDLDVESDVLDSATPRPPDLFDEDLQTGDFFDPTKIGNISTPAMEKLDLDQLSEAPDEPQNIEVDDHQQVVQKTDSERNVESGDAQRLVDAQSGSDVEQGPTGNDEGSEVCPLVEGRESEAEPEVAEQRAGAQAIEDEQPDRAPKTLDKSDKSISVFQKSNQSAFALESSSLYHDLLEQTDEHPSASKDRSSSASFRLKTDQVEPLQHELDVQHQNEPVLASPSSVFSSLKSDLPLSDSLDSPQPTKLSASLSDKTSRRSMIPRPDNTTNRSPSPPKLLTINQGRSRIPRRLSRSSESAAVADDQQLHGEERLFGESQKDYDCHTEGQKDRHVEDDGHDVETKRKQKPPQVEQRTDADEIPEELPEPSTTTTTPTPSSATPSEHTGSSQSTERTKTPSEGAQQPSTPRTSATTPPTGGSAMSSVSEDLPTTLDSLSQTPTPTNRTPRSVDSAVGLRFMQKNPPPNSTSPRDRAQTCWPSSKLHRSDNNSFLSSVNGTNSAINESVLNNRYSLDHSDAHLIALLDLQSLADVPECSRLEVWKTNERVDLLVDHFTVTLAHKHLRKHMTRLGRMEPVPYFEKVEVPVGYLEDVILDEVILDAVLEIADTVADFLNDAVHDITTPGRSNRRLYDAFNDKSYRKLAELIRFKAETLTELHPLEPYRDPHSLCGFERRTGLHMSRDQRGDDDFFSRQMDAYRRSVRPVNVPNDFGRPNAVVSLTPLPSAPLQMTNTPGQSSPSADHTNPQSSSPCQSSPEVQSSGRGQVSPRSESDPTHSANTPLSTARPVQLLADFTPETPVRAAKLGQNATFESVSLNDSPYRSVVDNETDGRDGCGCGKSSKKHGVKCKLAKRIGLIGAKIKKECNKKAQKIGPELKEALKLRGKGKKNVFDPAFGLQL